LDKKGKFQNEMSIKQIEILRFLSNISRYLIDGRVHVKNDFKWRIREYKCFV